MRTPPTNDKAMPSAFSWKRLIPVAILVTGIVAFFALGLRRYLTLDELREHRGELTAFVMAQPILSVLLFITIYALATSFSLPGGAVLTVTSGFLFGIWLGTAAVVIAATIGATIIFLAARTALGDMLRSRSSSSTWSRRSSACRCAHS